MEKVLIVKWKIRETETQRILKLLPTLVEATKKEPGNTSYSVFQSETDPNELILHECYTDQDSLDAHKKTAHYQTLVVNEIIPHLEVREVTIVSRLF